MDILESLYLLNNLLHIEGIPEKLRSQFVGTCLLALKNGVKYEDRTTSEIIVSISKTLEVLLCGVAKNMEIKLPVDSNGEPDWQFMENYIKALPYGDRL